MFFSIHPTLCQRIATLTRVSKFLTSLRIDKREFAPLLEIFKDGIVAIDLETTGLSPLIDEIIELAAIKITPESLDVWDTLIDPQKPIPPETTEIHGITDQMVEGQPVIKEVFEPFLKFTEGLPIIAHNAKFDIGFLVFSQHQNKIELKRNEVYCTVKASRKAFPHMESHRLGNLCEKLDIKLENHHRATDDALACLYLFNKCVQTEHKDIVLKESRLFNTEDFKRNTFSALPKKLEILKKKAERQTVVDIKYKGGSHKGKYRPIKPVSLLPMPEGNILYALCLLTNIYKSFALSKIQDVKELNAEEISERFKNLEKHLKKS